MLIGGGFFVVPVFGMTVLGDRAVGMTHTAVRQMHVIMGVFVDREGRGGTSTEQLSVFGTFGNSPGVALTADMAIQTDNAVGPGHNHMQIVGNHDDAAVEGVT